MNSVKVIDNLEYEKNLYNKGIEFIAGVDEVGRGPLVGPVVTACIVLPKGYILEGLTDSKKLSEKKREYFYDIIMKDALGIGIGIKDEKVIDEVNIYEATKLAMYEAISNVGCKVEHVLIDAMKLEDLNIPSTSIIKGDYLSQTIAAASVIAKVTRDRMMDELDKKYPEYNFKKNKGYPTKEHKEAIEKYGIIKEHRKTFKPVSYNLNKHYNDKKLKIWYYILVGVVMEKYKDMSIKKRSDLKMLRNLVLFLALIIFTFWFIFKDQDLGELFKVISSVDLKYAALGAFFIL